MKVPYLLENMLQVRLLWVQLAFFTLCIGANDEPRYFFNLFYCLTYFRILLGSYYTYWLIFFLIESIITNKYVLDDLNKNPSYCTPLRTPRISGLKSQILKPTFLA